MRYRFFTCDVFTDTRFGGNQLAVHPEAEGLTTEQMQRIAREFNFSETTFVLPPERGHDRRVRIFTPTQEVPFAGHPNIGTAFVLAKTGAFGALGASSDAALDAALEAPGSPRGADSPSAAPHAEPRTVTFEEDAGLVAVTIERREGERIACELKAPQRLSLGATVAPEAVAAAVSLSAGDVVTTAHEPLVASVGLPFVMAELRDRDALERARPSSAGAEALLAAGAEVPDVHLYVRSGADDPDGFDLRTRMFAPLDGIPEDPATGSANCVLAALLSHLETAPEGAFTYRIAQGFEMGRPSVLEARTEKRDGEVTGVWIGGESVMVSEGFIEV
jgi:trans-2,3-dihydro-3-hydroxyanthranilate isomerase